MIVQTKANREKKQKKKKNMWKKGEENKRFHLGDMPHFVWKIGELIDMELLANYCP